MFKIGDVYIRTDAYGNRFEMKVIDRTDDCVMFEEYTLGGKQIRKFDIYIDDGRRYGTEYVDIGRWQNINHYVYAR